MRSMNPGSWCVNPLWSWRQTVDVMSRFSEDTGARHGSWRETSSHLACWLAIESMMWAKASYVENRPCRPLSR
jgi:hypothetical protein